MANKKEIERFHVQINRKQKLSINNKAQSKKQIVVTKSPLKSNPNINKVLIEQEKTVEC
jgi:hypothetical protein